VNNTNAIEKALQERVSAECREIVDDFISDLEKLSNKYGGSMFYDFNNSKDNREFSVQGTHGVTQVLHKMILDNHGSNMLKYKSKELLNTLSITLYS